MLQSGRLAHEFNCTVGGSQPLHVASHSESALAEDVVLVLSGNALRVLLPYALAATEPSLRIVATNSIGNAERATAVRMAGACP